MVVFACSMDATVITFEEAARAMKRFQEVPPPKIKEFKFHSINLQPITKINLQDLNSVNPESRKYKNKKFR